MQVLNTDVDYALEKLMINLPAKHFDIYEDTLTRMIAAATGKLPALQAPSF